MGTKEKNIRTESQKQAEATQAESGREDACRCKETADMKPGELLKLMIRDLAFWKKGKK